jgi:type I restriction enzyme, S subunit
MSSKAQPIEEDVETPDYELPEGWATAQIRDVLTINYGKGLKESVRLSGSVPVYGSNGIVGKHTESLTRGPAIIIGRKGTVGAVHFSPIGCWPIDTTYFIDNFRGFDGTYLTLALQTLRLIELDTSTAIPGLNRDDIYAERLIVAPAAEQKRIVERIEQVDAIARKARNRLARCIAATKAFRQAVLAAACSGKLTEDWRARHPELKSGTDLQKEMRSNRKAEWHQLQSSRRPKKNVEYCEPLIPEIAENIPEIPDAWCTAGIDLLLSLERRGMKTGPFGTSLKKSEHQTTGIAVLGIENIGKMKFIEGSKIHISQAKADELAEFDALPGDILVSRSGTVGEVCVVPQGLGEARISTNIMRLTLVESALLPQLFCYLFNGSPFILQQVSQLCAGSTRDFLNQTILRSILFPIPPPDEQQEIVRRVEALFKLADAIEKRVAAASVRAERLTQAILAKAFRGELVPTEAELARREGREYEPASVLLERIKRERAADEEKTKGRKIKKARAVQHAGA